MNVSVTIPRVETENYGGSEFLVYCICVRHNITSEFWIVKRRYTEFWEFHEALKSRYDFDFIRSLNFPQKRFSTGDKIIQERRQVFEEYLSKLMKLDPHPSELVLFLRLLTLRSTARDEKKIFGDDGSDSDADVGVGIDGEADKADETNEAASQPNADDATSEKKANTAKDSKSPSWKDSSGRRSGDDGYVFGDLTRSVVSKLSTPTLSVNADEQSQGGRKSTTSRSLRAGVDDAECEEGDDQGLVSSRKSGVAKPLNEEEEDIKAHWVKNSYINVSVRITGMQMGTYGGAEFLEYCIEVVNGDTDDKWVIARRYSEFFDLHQALKRRVDRAEVQSFNFPAKTLIGPSKARTEERRVAFENYLSQLVKMVPIPTEVVFFLRLMSVKSRLKGPDAKLFGAAEIEYVDNEKVTDSPDEKIKAFESGMKSSWAQQGTNDHGKEVGEGTGLGGDWMSDIVVALTSNTYLVFFVAFVLGCVVLWGPMWLTSSASNIFRLISSKSQ